MNVFETIQRLRAHLHPLRGGRIGFVPTMGALHDGHLDLIRRARAAADTGVVSIFVNPAQFAPHEDFDSYPRDIARDVELIKAVVPDAVVFTPAREEIYATPPTLAGASSQTTFKLGEIDTRWESTFRPHFLAGVALVVSKLFHIVQPDAAFFGEKDFQQLQVIRQMVRDLSFPLEITGVPIVRESSGLAMSSRNAYLTAAERNEMAPQLFAALAAAAKSIRAGGDVAAITQQSQADLRAARFRQVDYFAYVDAQTLAPLAAYRAGGRLLAAAWLGNTRLIDNIAVE